MISVWMAGTIRCSAPGRCVSSTATTPSEGAPSSGHQRARGPTVPANTSVGTAGTGNDA